MLIGWSAPGVELVEIFDDDDEGCALDLDDGSVYGNSTGSTDLDDDWNSDTIVTGTKIGLMVDFNQDGTATVTAYQDGVKVGVLSTGSLRGPLCPGVCLGRTGQSVEFVSSKHPHS